MASKKRERLNKFRYDEFERQGLVTVTPGETIDYAKIRETIGELGKTYDIQEIAIDRWNAVQLAQQLDDDGFTIVGFGQGYMSMNAPTKYLETCVLNRTLQHNGDKVARWMIGNLVVEQDAAGNLKPSKKKAPEKIDGAVALVMALGRVLVEELKGEGQVIVL